jgi:hypothetical protein
VNFNIYLEPLKSNLLYYGCSSVVEELPRMYKALGSIPSKRDRERERQRERERKEEGGMLILGTC